MILKKEDTEATILGEVQTNTVGIDTKNIGLITTLLSTNLYSNPLQSFIRETVSNAWDSHLEAKNMEDPILLTINLEDNKVHISIRDYGTGLSEQRFNDIYLNICSSSKRESNDYIGCMGLGRLSALALSDTVTINNYYDGKVSSYLMYMDGGLIHINKVFEKDTEEHNGLEVSVIVDNTFSSNMFKSALEQVKYFEKVYLDTNMPYIKPDSLFFNNRKIVDTPYFKACNWPNTAAYHKNISVCMGNVLYPLPDNSDLRKPFNETFGLYYKFDLKMPISSIDVTPSRESLLFNNRTKYALQEALDSAEKFISRIILEEDLWNFTSVTDYYESMIHGKHCYISTVPYCTLTKEGITSYVLLKLSPKINNIPVDYTIFKHILHAEVSFKDFESVNTINTKLNNFLKYSQLLDKLKNKRIIVLKDRDYTRKNLITIKKEYSTSNLYDAYHVTLESTLSNIVQRAYKYLLQQLAYLKIDVKEIRTWYKLFLEESIKLKDNLIYFNPADYKKDSVKTDNSQYKQGLKCLAYQYVNNYSRQNVSKKLIKGSEIMQGSPTKDLYVYGFKEDKDFKNIAAFYLCVLSYHRPCKWKKHTPTIFIEISKRDADTLNGLSHTMYYKDFINIKDNYLSKVLTGLYIKRAYKFEDFDYRILMGDKYMWTKYSYGYKSKNIDEGESLLHDLYWKKGWLKYNILIQANEIHKTKTCNNNRDINWKKFLNDSGFIPNTLLQYMFELKYDSTLTFKERRIRIQYINKHWLNYEYKFI